MLTVEELEELQNISIDQMDPNTLVDLNSIRVILPSPKKSALKCCWKVESIHIFFGWEI